MEGGSSDHGSTHPDGSPPHSPGNGGRRFTLSSKTGEGAGSMQLFIQREIMSILEPIADHVKDVEEEVRELARRITEMDDKASKSHERLDKVDKTLAAHAVQIEDIESELRPVRVAIRDLVHRVTTLEGTSSAHGDRIAKADGRIETVNESVHALRKSLEDTDATAGREQAKLSQTSKLAGRLEAGLAEIKESHNGLCDRHLNLARGHQHTMQNSEAIRQDLTRLAAKLQSDQVETDRVVAAAVHRVENGERMLEGLREEVSEKGKALSFAIEDISRLSQNLGEVQNRMRLLQVEDGSTLKTQQHMQKMDEILARVDRDLAKELEKDNYSAIRGLHQQVCKHGADLLRHASGLSELDGRQQHHEERIRGMEVHTWDLETKGAKLRQRADRADAHIGSLSSQHKTAALRLDLQGFEAERTKAQQLQMSRDLGEAASTLHGLNSEMTHQQKGIQGVNERLNLAHEYIDGLGRGLQDTHKHVVAGQSSRRSSSMGISPMVPTSMAISPLVLPSPVPSSNNRSHTPVLKTAR